jgi:hypothetical protein
LSQFEEAWKNLAGQLCAIPGIEALSAVNQRLQESYGISITPTAMIEAILPEEIPEDMRNPLDALGTFARMKTG